jgi:hypothetical protein
MLVYNYMRNDREQANILRKSGLSYSDIKSRMGVPKSTLSTWFHEQNWSNEIALESIKKSQTAGAIRLVVMNTVRGSRLKKIYEEASQDAFVDFHELKFHPLFMAGVMLYWSHGDKSSKHRISLSSRDPAVILLIKNFLEKICSVKNMKARLILSEDLNEESAKSFWMEKCGLKPEQFGKTTKVLAKKATPFRKSTKKVLQNNGVCNLTITSAYLKNKILKWIELLSADIAGIV